MPRCFVLALCLSLLLPEVASSATLPAGQPLTAEMARELVAAALPEAPSGGRWQVQLMPAGFPLPNHARTDGWMEIEAIDLEPRSGLLDASLRVTLEGGQAGIIALRGRVEAQVQVAVPARALRRGERIDEADLGSVWLPSGRLDQETLLEAADLVGREAGRALPAGRAVRAADLRAPRLVRKDEAVTLLYSRGGLELRSSGTALESAAEGQPVRVAGSGGGRPIRGIVVGPRLVRLGGAEGGR